MAALLGRAESWSAEVDVDSGVTPGEALSGGGVPGAWELPPAAGAVVVPGLRTGVVVVVDGPGVGDCRLVVGGELVVGIGSGGWPGAAVAALVAEVAAKSSAPTPMANDASRPDGEANDILSPLLPATPAFLPTQRGFSSRRVVEV
ncbi:MAG: hypothetical protein NVSMB4_05170 [Acidimicrobiales bacterium]